MQVEIQDTGKCKRLLKFEIPAEQVKEKIEEKYSQLLKEAEVPGFRRGHVPRKLLERKFGKRIQDEIKESLITSAIDEAVEKNKIQVIGHIDLPDTKDLQADGSSPLKFEITVTVKPEVSVSDYVGTEVEVEEPTVSDEEVEAEIERIRTQTAELVVVEGRPVAPTHTLVVSISVTAEGREIFKSENAYFSPASKGLFGVPIEDLSSKVLGLNRDDSFEVSFTISQTCSLATRKELIGKTATAKIKINEIKELKKPDATDEWAKSIGFETLAELKSKTKERIKKYKEDFWKSYAEESILSKLIEKTQIEVPSELIAKRADELASYRAFRLAEGGVEKAKIDADIKEYREYTAQEIEHSFRKDLIVSKIAELENIFITEEEVDAEIATMARERGVSEAHLIEQLEKENLLGQLRADMLTNKVKTFLREKANIKVLPPGSLKKKSEEKRELEEKKSDETCTSGT